MKYVFAALILLVAFVVVMPWNHTLLSPLDAAQISPPCGVPAWTASPGAQINSGPFNNELLHLESCAASAAAPLPYSPIYSVTQSFGAKCDGSTDDSAALQNAVNAAGQAGGGTVYIPAGVKCATTVPIINGFNNVFLQCDAVPNQSHTTGSQLTTSQIFWIGGSNGPDYEIAPSPGPSPAQAITGGGVINCGFGGNQSQTIGLEVLSLHNGYFHNVWVDPRAATYASYWGSVTQLGEATDTNHNIIDGFYCNGPGFSGKAPCMYLDGGGTPGGDFSFNTIRGLQCQIGTSGSCLVANDADNDVFYDTYCFGSGITTGDCVDLKSGVNSLVFIHIGYQHAPFVAENGSFQNSAFQIDSSNSDAIPTINSGADLNFTYTGDQAMQFQCASVTVGGATCTFPSSFAFHATTYTCTYGVEGSTSTVSISSKSATGFTATSSSGTITVDFNCVLKRTT